MISGKLKILFTLQLLLLIAFGSQAHNINQSYLYLRVYENSLEGRFEISINDLNKAIGSNLSNDITVDDLKLEMNKVQNYFLQRTEFTSIQGHHTIEFIEPSLLNVGGQLGTFALIKFRFPDLAEVPELMDVKYDIFFDKDDSHLGMLIIEYSWRAGIMNNESLPSIVFKKDNIIDQVNLYEGSLFLGFLNMVKEGVWHIWIGIDHILFLLALILPAVITRGKDFQAQSNVAWSILIPSLIYNPSPDYYTPVSRFKPAFLYILKIVTFFTISHTITLGLAAFEIIILPSRLIESVIAISISMAALHNITPIFKGKEWAIAFIFGLFHGFGFASVLSELRAGDFLGLTLFGFNLGVEIGQIAVIIVIFPILFFLRKKKVYNYLLVFGSFVLIFISLYWFIERAFEVDLPLGRYFIQAYQSVAG